MLQAIIQFFVNRYPEHLKFAPAFCQKVYNNSFLEDQLFITWYNKTEKLDKDCILYDRKAEKTMRTSLAEFVAWLQSADYDEEQDYGEEETTKNNEEEKKEVVETEA